MIFSLLSFVNIQYFSDVFLCEIKYTIHPAFERPTLMCLKPPDCVQTDTHTVLFNAV